MARCKVARIKAFGGAAILLALLLGFGSGAPAAEARQGPPDLEKLHERMLPLFEIDGVVYTDANEDTGRLVVGVRNRGIARSIEARFGPLGIPANLVDIVETQEIHQLATLRDQAPALQGGLQINFPGFLCTLGFNAVRNGIAGFVTNSHCTSTQGGVEGTPYYQPLASVNPVSVGTEIADPTYSRSNCPGGFGTRVCRWSDSAFVQRANGVAADQSFIKKTTGPNNGSLTIDGSFEITGENTASVGQVVNKVGRTTGWTQGAVDNTCVNVGVSGTRIVQLCQSMVEVDGVQMVAGGDSGSPVFRITGGDDVDLVGILWGGSTDGSLFVFSPLANIERSDELGPLDTVASSGGGNTSPVAVNNAYSVAEGGTLNVPAAGVLANDTDADGDPLTAVLVSGPSNDTAFALNADGSFTYTHDGSETASDSFTYRASDGAGLSNLATVSITVNPVNDNAPVADAGSATTNQLTPIAVTLTGTDADGCGAGQTFTYQVTTPPASGTAGPQSGSATCIGGALSADVTFTPDEPGDYSFQFLFSDGATDSAAATVSVTVNEVASDNLHVGDIDAVSNNNGSEWDATVTIRVHDAGDGPVSGAQVDITWGGGASGNASCVTGADGSCSLTSPGMRKRVGDASMTVTGVSHTLTYAPAGNHDPDGDSDGTVIQFSKP